MFEKEAEEYTINKMVDLEDFDSYQSSYDRYESGVQDAFKDGADFGYNKGKKEMVNVIKLLITTLDTTTWREDSESPSRSGRETFYNCPDCSCKDCYRVACEYNKSEIFKQLYQDFPELYNLQIYK